MRDDIDYEWGWNQIERHLAEMYGASANICNIASNIRARSKEVNIKKDDEVNGRASSQQ